MAQRPITPGEASTAMGIRLPMSTADRLADAAKARGLRRADVLRAALDEWLAQHAAEDDHHTAA